MKVGVVGASGYSGEVLVKLLLRHPHVQLAAVTSRTQVGKPLGQVIASARREDSGSAAANPVASGYQRVLLSPGVEFHLHPFMFYADVELPVYQNTNGDQLIGSFLVKGSISYRF